MSRTIAIGDIHGCATALDRLLDEIAPQPDDLIICVGDYVDRGMDSARVIEILLELVTQCRFVPLIGNHELMMFKGLRSQSDFQFWFQHGGNATVASYGGRVQNIPQHHLSFLSHCVRFYETETHFFVHANYEPDTPLAEQPDGLLFWEHINEFAPPPHYTGKTAVVGHTPQADGRVRDLGHIKIIDTFCYGDQWLSGLEVNTGEIWQANNAGDFRRDRLGHDDDELVESNPEDDDDDDSKTFSANELNS